MDTGTFKIENIILNRHPALSALTHPGRVQQNFQQLKTESSNMVALPCFNFNAEATPQMETSKKGPGADSVQDRRDTTVTSSQATPMDHPMDNIQPPTRKSISTMNVHSQDSHSNKSDRLKKSKVQGNQLTRFSHHSNTDFTCDQKNLPRDLHNYWNDRETLSTNLKMDTNMDTNHMTTIQHLMSEHCYVIFPTGQPDQRRIQHRRSTSQDSQATITQTNCVTEKADQQIFPSLGPTRNFYTTDPYSLIRDTRS